MTPNHWPKRDPAEPMEPDYGPLRVVEGLSACGTVYFLGSEDGTRVKIGYTGEDVERRLREHATSDLLGRYGGFRPLAFVRAPAFVEGRVQDHFKTLRVREENGRGGTEIYRADPPLVDYLTFLRDLYFVSTTLAEYRSEMGIEVIDPSMWLPGPGRVSYRRHEADLLSGLDGWGFLPTRSVTGDDYYTPPLIMDAARQAFEGGGIDLDPASHVTANANVQAARIYTIDQNGLTLPWAGRVWLNPPFSEWRRFSEKILAELDRGEITEMVILAGTRCLTTQYMAPVLARARAICTFVGRHQFWGIALDDGGSPVDGHFLIYVGPDVRRFATAVATLGPVWAPVEG